MRVLLIVICFLFYHVSSAKAQMTIINVPSADVEKKNHVFLQHEAQFRTKKNGDFYNATNYLTYGIGADTEVTLTSFNLGNLAKDNNVISTGFKSSISFSELSKNFSKSLSKTLEKYQFKAIVGSNLVLAVDEGGSGNWSYLLSSLTVPQSKTRLTFGATYGTKEIFGREGVYLACGIEQKITNQLSYIADWYSGQSNSFGIFAFGPSYSFKNGAVLIGGYQIANSKRIAQNAFFFEIAKSF